MTRAKTRKRFGLLDGILCALAVLAVAAAVCYFLASDAGAVRRFSVAGDAGPDGKLTQAALTGKETELSAPEINRMLGAALEKLDSPLKQLLVAPSGTENEIEYCMTVRYWGHDWVVSGKGTLLAKTENGTVTAFLFSPEQVHLGKLPISKALFFSLIGRGGLPDGVSAEDGKLSFSASSVPVKLEAFHVSKTAFVFKTKSPLDQLIDKIDEFVKKKPDEQQASAQELKELLSEQAKQALAQGSEAFEAFRETIEENFSALDVEQIFSAVEDGVQQASGSIDQFVEQHGDEIASAAQDLLDALRGGASS